MELNSLTDVLVEELGDLYSAEQQLVESLPRMAAAAHSSSAARRHNASLS